MAAFCRIRDYVDNINTSSLILAIQHQICNTLLFNIYTEKQTAESTERDVVKTYRLCGATQCLILLQRQVPFATCAKPQLRIIDGISLSLLFAKARVRKVRAWVAGTMVSMETDGLEIVRRWSGKGKLNVIVQRKTIWTRPNARWTYKGKAAIILLTDRFTEAVCTEGIHL